MHGRLRLQRECVRYMIYAGWTSNEVTVLKGIPASTLRQWRTNFLKFGVVDEERRRRRQSAGPRQQNRPVTPAVKVVLQNVINRRPWLYLDEIREELSLLSGVYVSCSTIWKVLTKEMKHSLQIAQFAAKQQNDLDRALHQNTLYNVTTDPAQFCFLR